MSRLPLPMPSTVSGAPIARRRACLTPRQWRSRRRVASLGLLASLVVGATLGPLGCSGDTLNGPPPIDAAHAYWTLQIPQVHAINLALTPPYDTVRLSAAAHNTLGAPLPGLGTVTWTAGLDSSVSVDATGLVTARRVTGQVTTVIASLLDAQQHLTLSDTVYIQVTQSATPIKTFSVQPVQGDSAIRSLFSPGPLGSAFTWYVTAVDSAGDSVCTATNGCNNLLVRYGTSDTSTIQLSDLDPNCNIFNVAYLCPGFKNQATGTAYVTATTLAYGQMLRDSVQITIKPPSGYLINVVTVEAADSTFTAVGFSAPQTLTLGAGAVVQWSSYASGNATPFNIQFDQPSAADTASCQVTWTSAVQLVNFGRYPPTFAPTGSGNTDLFGADTTGLGAIKQGFSIQIVFDPDLGAVTDTTWFINNCRARRFRTPGTYHWHSSLFPNQTFTLTIVP